MPFVKRIHQIQKPLQAFLFIMQTVGISQAKAQRFIHFGKLIVNGEVILESAKVIFGEAILEIFEPKDIGINPLFTANDFMVFDKPSGIFVHPKTRATPLSMLDAVRFYGGDDANATHRIDKETSGLLLSSTNKKSEITLKLAFEKRLIKKSYLAWVRGKIERDFSVNLPIKKRDNYETNKHKVAIDTLGKEAFTAFSPLFYDSNLNATLLECFPKTGRMHQIRVHLFHVKHPIIGDPLYGTSFEVANRYLDDDLRGNERVQTTGAPRLMLHANRLEFDFEGVKYIIRSGVDFKSEGRKILEKCGFYS